MLTIGQKCNATRLHNEGWGLSHIAKTIRAPEAIVLAYLERRQGYPGQILSRRQPPRAKVIDDGGTERQAEVIRRVPSLPKLRFMGEV